jgi:hypothetical protein
MSDTEDKLPMHRTERLLQMIRACDKINTAWRAQNTGDCKMLSVGAHCSCVLCLSDEVRGYLHACIEDAGKTHKEDTSCEHRYDVADGVCVDCGYDFKAAERKVDDSERRNPLDGLTYSALHFINERCNWTDPWDDAGPVFVPKFKAAIEQAIRRKNKKFTDEYASKRLREQVAHLEKALEEIKKKLDEER